MSKDAMHSEPITDTRCGATIVGFGVSARAQVEVRVFDDHLTIRQARLGTWTIYGAEIRSLAHQTGPLGGGAALAIEHAVPEFGSSIALKVEPDHPVRRAIVKMRRDVPRPAGVPPFAPASNWTAAFVLGPLRLWRARRG